MPSTSDTEDPRYSCADCPRWFRSIEDMEFLDGSFYCPECFDTRTRLNAEV